MTQTLTGRTSNDTNHTNKDGNAATRNRRFLTAWFKSLGDFVRGSPILGGFHVRAGDDTVDVLRVVARQAGQVTQPDKNDRA